MNIQYTQLMYEVWIIMLLYSPIDRYMLWSHAIWLLGSWQVLEVGVVVKWLHICLQCLVAQQIVLLHRKRRRGEVGISKGRREWGESGVWEWGSESEGKWEWEWGGMREEWGGGVCACCVCVCVIGWFQHGSFQWSVFETEMLTHKSFPLAQYIYIHSYMADVQFIEFQTMIFQPYLQYMTALSQPQPLRTLFV